MRTSFLRLLPLLLLVLASPAVIAQPAEDPGERLRIGLVLGGGGARGAAHIGVLKELERQRIPIDAIAGTSMGAIVGSLYASGMTPDELEALVGSIDWADAFIDNPQRQGLSYRRKQDDAAYPVKLELGLSDGEVLVPKGLIQGQKLQLILREQLLHVAHVTNFDDLPTPFRAVASDIATGEVYVMGRGDLALAARASMSAPGIFSPVVVDGRTLVDGGLGGNVPVSVVRDMDVDVVIAVDVEFPLYKPEQLQSALAISEQMLTILIRKETRRQLSELDEHDILIRPDMGDYGSTNFDDIVDIITPGESATVDAATRLSAYSMSERDYQAFATAKRRPAAEPETIDFVRVLDAGPLSADELVARLDTKAGDRVDTQQLAADLDRLYGLQYYQHVDYRLVREDGRTGVEFRTTAKSWGPNFLKFGLSLEDDFEGSTAFNVAARVTATGLNSLGAEWRNDVQLGTNPRFDSELYQPL
ncbi:MAG: patatin-like phospholipase family protein, partial [Gammaproteobacteria bacterium]|nr:patatin-like phospholipase family protein [Gammaproteobacteria bacterium]